MRHPQRNFVVEYKSSRRQARPANASIWGNANLKELLALAEEEVPVGADTVQQSAPEVEVSTAGTMEENRSHDFDQAVVAPEHPDASLSLEQSHSSSDDVADVAPAKSRETIVKPKRNRRRSERLGADRGVRGHSVTVTGQDVITDAMLEDLEAENLRLRSLLIKHLRVQNKKLAAMLHRADSR
ncbi:hypothetical protein DEM27_24265 [Metarhizobium album]|uniref:Uncharacterized protein n=1 Tax=Metarhizobium album TaxID=2182425 RepID=A0A2U2DK42_9HYPH|nr:hypothetical protein [Rhizobium album]PWE53664.1 hypothetical protein DEM27_24265 [Rhizobium album]